MFRIRAPQWFLNCIPKEAKLDGELYAGEKCFQLVNSIVKMHVKGSGRVTDKMEMEWAYLTFMVFDLPHMNAPFEERYKLLSTRKCLKDNPVVQVVKHTKLVGTWKEIVQHIRDAFNYVVGTRGEGLVLRKGTEKYQQGKQTQGMLKIKQRYVATAEVTWVAPPAPLKERVMKTTIEYNNHEFTNVSVRGGGAGIHKGMIIQVSFRDWTFEKGKIAPRYPRVEM